jgi:type I restriction-modification system DNA methylase subunit
MEKMVLSSVDVSLEEKLFNALISYFQHENDKLGLSIENFQIDALCRTLLYGNYFDTNPAWQIAETTVFDEYRKGQFEIIDYLHLVSTELRKQLGQYSTPSSIVKYILKSIGYSVSKDILHKTLVDPACGSGAFLADCISFQARVMTPCLLKTSKTS